MNQSTPAPASQKDTLQGSLAWESPSAAAVLFAAAELSRAQKRRAQLAEELADAEKNLAEAGDLMRQATDKFACTLA